MTIEELFSGSYLFKARIAAPATMLMLLWLWETWQPLFGHKHRLRHAARNIGLTIANSILIALLFSALTVSVAQWTTLNHFGLLNWLPIGSKWAFLLGIVMLDGWMYVWHRANHAIGFLWRFHRMHHSDNQMDVTTASRFHIGEHVMSSGLRICLMPLLGINIWQLITYEILVVAVAQMHHADISLGPVDRWLRLLIVTPDMHKLHHSRLKAETDSNYSTVLSIWDRIARSFRMRRDIGSIEFGLKEFDDPRWQTISGMLQTPFRKETHDSSHHGREP